MNDSNYSSTSDQAPSAPSIRDYRIAEVRKGLDRRWVFTPLNGKIPLNKEWTAEPAPAPGTVFGWATSGNIGLRTGSISGVTVLDDDSEDGSASEHLNLPRTPTVITGSGKRHHYFRSPDCGLKNSASKLAPKLDIRGDGGQVVFPGSTHPDTGKPYYWAVGLTPDDVPLAEFPESLLRKLRDSGRKTHEHQVQLVSYARGALRIARDDMASAAVGTRNDTLNRSAYAMGRFVGAGLLEKSDVEADLTTAAKSTGLGEGEIHTTLCSGLNAGLAEALDLDELESRLRTETTEKRPTIVVEGGKLPKIVDRAEHALMNDGGDQLYQRGSTLVRVARSTPLVTHRKGRPAPGPLMLVRLDTCYLTERLTKAIRWRRLDQRTGELKDIDCPTKYAATLLARLGNWKHPALLGVIEAPTVRHEGGLVETPGYDPGTRLFYDPGGLVVPAISAAPTKDDADAALNTLDHVLGKFPWVAASDKSAALSAILTALVRRTLRTAPMFAISAPKMSSGKSLLADVVSLIATGRCAPVMSQGKDEDEIRKRVFSVLLEGDPVASIDNIERPLDDPVLCSVLTQEVFKDRRLGVSETVTVPTSTTWLATGNNLVIAGDLTTRVIPCDLDPQMERPEERTFETNLHEYIPRNRGKLIAAALTILLAYDQAGRPAQGLRTFGRFEEWSNRVRSALVWAGLPDPCEGRKRLIGLDPVRANLCTVLRGIHEAFGSKPSTARQIIGAAEPLQTGECSEFFDVILEICSGADGRPNAQRLGQWLLRHVDRIEGGLQLQRGEPLQGTSTWIVRSRRGA